MFNGRNEVSLVGIFFVAASSVDENLLNRLPGQG
jgi:hypothetical protein